MYAILNWINEDSAIIITNRYGTIKLFDTINIANRYIDELKGITINFSVIDIKGC